MQGIDNELLEWILYNRLMDISFLAQGGFSKINKARWLDGWIKYWDYEKQNWERYVNVHDCENSINDSLKSNGNYGYHVALKSLNESYIYEDFLYEWKIHLQCQHKAGSNNSILVPLLGIIREPNILNYMIVMPKATLSSLRNNLMPVNQSNINNDIYGVLPYMAPEVLRGEPYTKAADIHSFGIIMWEMTSGIPARCWNNDPEKRPTSSEFKNPEIVYHPKSCYTNRIINYAAKLYEMLLRDELSDKIVMNNNNYYENETMTSENLESCMIKN
ncbi:kinase-like domain-containing protein [Rhizophagus irregularis DAOM 181602=DAOM 197198]|nr:kinase-like domain-containing protein [Rhizophagus irregularis DAOM 181602=DAOM 197198]